MLKLKIFFFLFLNLVCTRTYSNTLDSIDIIETNYPIKLDLLLTTISLSKIGTQGIYILEFDCNNRKYLSKLLIY